MMKGWPVSVYRTLRSFLKQLPKTGANTGETWDMLGWALARRLHTINTIHASDLN